MNLLVRLIISDIKIQINIRNCAIRIAKVIEIYLNIMFKYIPSLFYIIYVCRV